MGGKTTNTGTGRTRPRGDGDMSHGNDAARRNDTSRRNDTASPRDVSRRHATARQRRAEQTRRSILESALELFRDRGFSSVTVEEITRTAGVAKGSFYTHFATKSDIIVAEFKQIDAYYRRYADRNLSRHATAADKLTAFTRAQMRYVRDTVGVSHLKILYANQTVERDGEKILTTPHRHWFSIVEEIVAEGQERAEFRDDIPADRLAELINRATRATFLDWCITDGAFDLVREGLSVVREWMLPALTAQRSGEGRASEVSRAREEDRTSEVSHARATDRASQAGRAAVEGFASTEGEGNVASPTQDGAGVDAL